MANQSEERMRQLQNQMRALQNQMTEIAEEDVVKVKWHPQRSGKITVPLSDGSFIVGLPETVMDESDPQARVVLALLGEVLTLRDEVAALRRHIGGQRPEMSPVPELKGEAVAFKESVTAKTEKENAKEETATPAG